MSKIVNRKLSIELETGEILNEKNWIGYDGFTKDGYQYRRRSIFIRYYFDAIPENLSESSWQLLLMIAELMNEENLLVYRVERKSKFSTIIYKPYSREEIAERVRYKFGWNKFRRCWQELSKHCLKRVKHKDYVVWAVNPAVISKCRAIPLWLCAEFMSYLEPFLSAKTIQRMQEKIKNQY